MKNYRRKLILHKLAASADATSQSNLISLFHEMSVDLQFILFMQNEQCDNDTLSQS